MADNSKLFFINLNVDSDDRYDLAKFMEFSDNFDPISSTIMNEIKDVELGGEYIINKEEGRPDLVSYNIFGTTQYWQLIMMYNDIDDVDAFVIGKKIKYPNLASLEDLFFSLKGRQSSSEREET